MAEETASERENIERAYNAGVTAERERLIRGVIEPFYAACTSCVGQGVYMQRLDEVRRLVEEYKRERDG